MASFHEIQQMTKMSFNIPLKQQKNIIKRLFVNVIRTLVTFAAFWLADFCCVFGAEVGSVVGTNVVSDAGVVLCSFILARMSASVPEYITRAVATSSFVLPYLTSYNADTFT